MSRLCSLLPSRSASIRWVAVSVAAAWAGVTAVADTGAPLVRYGGMHETLGEGKHHARVQLAELLEREHFYGVGAVEGLHGEITILDSTAFATAVTGDGSVEALDASAQAATLLVGQSVPAWSAVPLGEDLAPDELGPAIGSAAQAQGVDPSQPFVFLLEGDLTDVRLHVINGACPVRARIRDLDVPEDQEPFERELAHVEGTVVGIYAEDAVGRLTHPATRVHAHLIYVDEESGEKVTGHLERVGVAAGATLRVPTPDVPEAGQEDPSVD